MDFKETGCEMCGLYLSGSGLDEKAGFIQVDRNCLTNWVTFRFWGQTKSSGW